MLSRVLDGLDKALSWFEGWVLYLSVMIGLISLTVNVILRYAFSYPLAWSEELIRELIIITTFIGCSAGIKSGAMITIDAVVQLVPRLRRPLALVSNLAVLVFAVMVIVLGWDMAAMQARTHQKTIILEIPLVILYGILPLMGGMMGIRTVQLMYKDFLEARRAKETK
ncbi:MAG: TRAP transporter small permease [Deltaproteobacteria bacterium]|nr:TRAP transporter small permease [Deltaproteobacteria bacterium]